MGCGVTDGEFVGVTGGVLGRLGTQVMNGVEDGVEWTLITDDALGNVFFYWEKHSDL